MRWALSSTRLKRTAKYSGPGAFLTHVLISIREPCLPSCVENLPKDPGRMGPAASCSPVPDVGKGGAGHLSLTPHGQVHIPHMAGGTKNWSSCKGTTAKAPGIFYHFAVTPVLWRAHVPVVWLADQLQRWSHPLQQSNPQQLPPKQNTHVILLPAPLPKLACSASLPASPSPSLWAWKATAKCINRHICLTSVFVGRMQWVRYSPVCHFSTCLVFRMKRWSGP